MLLSNFIKKLEAIEEEHGDIMVVAMNVFGEWNKAEPEVDDGDGKEVYIDTYSGNFIKEYPINEDQ